MSMLQQGFGLLQRVFADDGEAAFRALESKALIEVCKDDKQVIATGGGMVIDPANQTLMNESGFVVCLEASPETIIQRLFLTRLPVNLTHISP